MRRRQRHPRPAESPPCPPPSRRRGAPKRFYLRSLREFYRAPGGRRAVVRRDPPRSAAAVSPVPGSKMAPGEPRSLSAAAAKMAAGSGFTRPTGKERAGRRLRRIEDKL